MLRNNTNSYINCSEQRARSRSVTLKYACIIIVIVIIIIIIIIISMCDSVRHCSTVRQGEWQCARSARGSVQQCTWSCMYGSAQQFAAVRAAVCGSVW